MQMPFEVLKEKVKAGVSEWVHSKSHDRLDDDHWQDKRNKGNDRIAGNDCMVCLLL